MPHSCVTVSRCHTSLGAKTYACKLIVPRSAYNAYVRHADWGRNSARIYHSTDSSTTEKTTGGVGTEEQLEQLEQQIL